MEPLPRTSLSSAPIYLQPKLLGALLSRVLTLSGLGSSSCKDQDSSSPLQP